MNLDRHVRKFLVRATGLSPYAMDQDVVDHLAALSPAVRQACVNHAEAERRETETDDPAERCRQARARDYVVRTTPVEPSTSPGDEKKGGVRVFGLWGLVRRRARRAQNGQDTTLPSLRTDRDSWERP